MPNIPEQYPEFIPCFLLSIADIILTEEIQRLTNRSIKRTSDYFRLEQTKTIYGESAHAFY